MMVVVPYCSGMTCCDKMYTGGEAQCLLRFRSSACISNVKCRMPCGGVMRWKVCMCLEFIMLGLLGTCPTCFCVRIICAWDSFYKSTCIDPAHAKRARAGHNLMFMSHCTVCKAWRDLKGGKGVQVIIYVPILESSLYIHVHVAQILDR